jgi:hypothetical protein
MGLSDVAVGPRIPTQNMARICQDFASFGVVLGSMVSEDQRNGWVGRGHVKEDRGVASI